MNGPRSEFKITAGTGKYTIEMIVSLVGRDIIAFIYGGDRPHVGAVALAVPRPSLKDNLKTSSTSSIITVIGHKEGDIAKMASEALASSMNRVAVVSAGLHIDNASEADIRKLLANAKAIVKKAVKIKLPD